MNPYGVDTLVSTIDRAGLQVPNPRRVGEQKCPRIGCVEAMESDTISIMKFPNTGRAQLYAGSTHGVLQVLDIVVTFSPGVTVEQRRSYEAAIMDTID